MVITAWRPLVAKPPAASLITNAVQRISGMSQSNITYDVDTSGKKLPPREALLLLINPLTKYYLAQFKWTRALHI